ncbi:hypothetical protein ACYOEI_15720 [Singulisphaera rosea]
MDFPLTLVVGRADSGAITVEAAGAVGTIEPAFIHENADEILLATARFLLEHIGQEPQPSGTDELKPGLIETIELLVERLMPPRLALEQFASRHPVPQEWAEEPGWDDAP